MDSSEHMGPTGRSRVPDVDDGRGVKWGLPRVINKI